MSELFLIIKTFLLENPTLVTWLIVALILVLGFLLQISWIKESFSEWELNRLLKNMGSKSLHNICITDGTDEKIFIEHLILTADNILLLSVKKFRGLIFAADQIDLWTQVVGKKSYKFDNPLHQLESDILVLNSKIENTKIVGKVLFINGSEFPKGKPENVISVLDVKDESKTSLPVSDELLADWNQLTELTVKNDLDKGVLINSDKSSDINTFSLLMTLLLLSVWLVWRLKF